MKKQIKSALILTAGLAIFGSMSCQKQTLNNENEVVIGEGVVNISMSSNISDIAIPARDQLGLPILNEKSISSIDVLVFTGDKYSYAVKATNISVVGNVVNYNVKLKKAGDQQLVFIGNLSAEVADIIASTGVGLIKDELMNLIRFEVPADQVWTEDNVLPTWIESKSDLSITDQTLPTDIFDLESKFIRSVAKVNLFNNDVNFTVKSVAIHNVNPEGFVDRLTKGVNIPNNMSVIPSVSKSFNQTATNVSNTLKAITEQFYVPEFDNKNQQSDADKLFVVIGGSYGAVDAPVSYYRIDFKLVEQFDIKRNHTYNIILTSLAGEGEGSVDDAVNSKPINDLGANIEEWENGADIDVTNNLVFQIDNTVALSGEEMDNLTIQFRTNYSKADLQVLADSNTGDWITVNAVNFTPNGSNGVTGEFNISVAKNPSSSASRSMDLTFKMGDYVKSVSFTQGKSTI